MNRRSFLKGAATLALATTCSSFALENESWDVLIIGGGVSGCYAGWRLARESRKSCMLLEGSDRIGGRLYSVTDPELPYLVAEVGGMRFKRSHRRVSSLVDHLELSVKPFPMGDAGNRIFVRGRHLRRGDLKSPEAVPYNLQGWERRGSWSLTSLAPLIKSSWVEKS